jgi:predicted lactoylglutathione lyase
MSSAGRGDLHDMDDIDVNPLLISLPIADRVRSRDFYRAALGFEAIGEPADDGVPEPLLLAPTAGVRLMLIPTGGFGWVVGDRDVAPPGTSECILGLGAATDAEVDAIVDRARRAGAVVTSEPTAQPWGYAANFTDPDGHLWSVTSARLPG